MSWRTHLTGFVILVSYFEVHVLEDSPGRFPYTCIILGGTCLGRLEDPPGGAKPEVKSTFCHSRVEAAAADKHLEWNGGFETRLLRLKDIKRKPMCLKGTTSSHRRELFIVS